MEAFPDAYLLVGRFVEPQVLDHLSLTRGAATQVPANWRTAGKSYRSVSLAVFALVALLLLLAAVWTGWTVAKPTGDTHWQSHCRLRNGSGPAIFQPAVQIEGGSSASDEIGMLSRAFNRMTEQINTQQEGLVVANRQLDERRKFT